MTSIPSFVIPAKAGTQSQLGRRARADWVPAFAGMTKFRVGEDSHPQGDALGAQDDIVRRQVDAFAHEVTGLFTPPPMATANIGTIRRRVSSPRRREASEGDAFGEGTPRRRGHPAEARFLCRTLWRLSGPCKIRASARGKKRAFAPRPMATANIGTIRCR